MATNERKTNRSPGEGRYIAETDPQDILALPVCGGYLCWVLFIILVIFSVFMTRSARGITSIIQKRLDKLREM